MTRRVLIADDSAVARLALAKRVRAEGADVVEAATAEGASRVDPRALACALLDYDLGDGYGVDVAERLRASDEGLPIAFFTSTTSPDVLERTRAFGPVFTKPDDLDRAAAWAASLVRGGGRTAD